MGAVVEIISASPILTVFLVGALGTVLGLIPFGPIRLGAAGALFVGLVVGNFVPGMSEELLHVQNLGLILFVYAVGLSAGHAFFANFRRQAKLIGGSVLALIAGAIVTVVVGQLLQLKSALLLGIYAGALTTTPALAAAEEASGSKQPGVGYSLAYPMGVIVGITLVALVVGRNWKGSADVPSQAGQRLFAATCKVTKNVPVRAIPDWKTQRIKISYLRRKGKTRIVSVGEELLPDDLVVVVGLEENVRRTIADLGILVSSHLANDRSQVDFRRFTVSTKDLANSSVAELNIAGRFGGVVTRIQRGDTELLAEDDLRLEIGDRVLVAFPREEYAGLAEFFGNSERQVAQVDAISMGLGIVLGLLAGMVEIQLPGGSEFALGPAAGPLIVGMILGALQRTGPIVWQIPLAANQIIRQLGLMLFLASVGIISGPEFMNTVRTPVGVKAMAVGLVAAFVVMGVMGIIGYALRLSATRTSGAMAGILGQPAILAYATGRKNDERIESGYAAIFAIGIVVKILIVTFMAAIII